MKLKFIRKIELYENMQLHYTADCNTKDEAALIKKSWGLRGKTHVKIKKYKNPKFRNEKVLICYKLFKSDTLIQTIWLPPTVGYYLKVYWLSEKASKVIEIEYIHHRWPKDYFTKKVTISKPTKAIKGL